MNIKSNTLFGMITTAKSGHYTELALKSFFTNTFLQDKDLFILIDNDDNWKDNLWPKVEVIKNKQPKSFAANINHLISIADKLELDLIMLNNDIVFTENWRAALEKRDDIICLPSCNQTHQHVDEKNEPIFKYTATIEEYLKKSSLLHDLAKKHSKPGYFERLDIPFYCFRLPKLIYKQIGLFDENFTPAGGEDVDYRIRALKEGYQTLYTNESYLLHFCGKSTWDGAENNNEISLRNKNYFNKFSLKYGEDAANLLCKVGQPVEKINQVVKKYNLVSTDSFLDVINKVINLNLSKINQSSVPLDSIAAEGLAPYLQNLGKDLVGCELGVCMGLTLRYFLDINKNIKKVYAIDAYKPYADHWGQVTQELIDRWKQTANMILAPYKEKIKFIEMDSFNAANLIQNDELDYIFIDGDHSFSAVASDLRRYWPKVRKGGIFAGHDWQLETVKSAVEFFRKEYNITTPIQFTKTNVWFWYKED